MVAAACQYVAHMWQYVHAYVRHLCGMLCGMCVAARVQESVRNGRSLVAGGRRRYAGGMSQSESPSPLLEELDQELLSRTTRAGGGGRGRVFTRSPFAVFLREHFDWFHDRHIRHAMTWRAWADLLTGRGMVNVDGGPLHPRALRGTYEREKAKRGKSKPRHAPPAAPPAPVVTDTRAQAPTPPAAPSPAPADTAPAATPARRGFRPAGGEKGA